MSATGLDVFDRTLQTTHVWLNEIKEELHTDDNRAAYGALRATLHALRDRLPVEEAADLGAQLPMLVRGIYYEGWTPARTPDKNLDREGFLSRIGESFQQNAQIRQQPQRVAQAVFKTLQHHVADGEIHDVYNVLPASIKELWPQDGR